MSEISFAESLDRLKESFLFAAAQGGNSQDCQSLIEIGADVNWKNSDGDTPLLAACRRGHSDTVSILIVHGADTNIISSKDGMAPLHICTRRGDNVSLDLLLAANTNTTLKSRDGHTALDIAKTKGYEDVYSRLMRQRRSISTIQLQRKPNSVNHLGLPSGNGGNRSIGPSQESVSEMLSSEDSKFETSNFPLSNNTNSSSNSSSSSNSNRRPDLTPVFNPRLLESKGGDRSSLGSRAGGGSSATTTSSSTESSNLKHSGGPGEYSIIGQGLPAVDEATTALKKILDTERAMRKALESKLEVFKNQNGELLSSLSSLSDQVSDLHDENARLETELDRMMGRKHAVDSMTLEECELVEKNLRSSLDILEVRKAVLIREKISFQKEQRLCVICQEKEKCVVLLPCRHLCLCEDCSTHDALTLCPLCRQTIAHKIGVYS